MSNVKSAKTHVIKTHQEIQDTRKPFLLSLLSEFGVGATKFVPWCSSARDSPFSLAVGSKEAGVTAETAQSKAAPYPAHWPTQPVCHGAAVLM